MSTAEGAASSGRGEKTGIARHLQHWGAVYALIALALIFNGVHAYYEVQHEISESAQHGRVYEPVEARNEWVRATAENMQSELWQIGLFQGVMLLAWKHRWFRADAEDIERIEKKIDELHERL
jgi:hypothetical protein